MNLNQVFGGFGAGTRVTALGKEWTFVFDVPAMAGIMEEMCKSWRRQRYEADLAELPGRNIAGSFDDRQATRLFDEFRADINNGACRIAAQGIKGGACYEEWSKTREGQFSGLLAALQIRHPEATLKTLADITNEAPGQIQAIMVELGNVLRTAVPKLAAVLKDREPETAKYLIEKEKEMEAILTASPA